MFPCFDEPDLKATFNVTVGYMPSMTALSNMPVIDTISRYYESYVNSLNKLSSGFLNVIFDKLKMKSTTSSHRP